jgi:hypothetical protein
MSKEKKKEKKENEETKSKPFRHEDQRLLDKIDSCTFLQRKPLKEKK